MQKIARGEWVAFMPVHLITRLTWDRFEHNPEPVWSWECICGTKGSATNAYIGTSIYRHLTGAS